MRRFGRQVLLAASLLVMLSIMTGCATDAEEPVVASEASETDVSTTSTVDVNAETTEDVVPDEEPASVAPILGESSKSAAAALGGTAQTGRTLYFVIVATEGSEAAAVQKRDAAMSAYAEQMYFVVEPSDHLEGLASGYWLVVEAFEEAPDAVELDWYVRVADDAYVRRARVLCDDPLPVVDDILSGAQ